jgi:hypothetical protein
VALSVERPFEVGRPLYQAVRRVSRCPAASAASPSARTRTGKRRREGQSRGAKDEQGFGFITPDHRRETRVKLHNKGRTDMASSGKKKTTMAKLTRESRLRERRLDKQAKKDARKYAAAHPLDQPDETLSATTGESDQPDTGQPALETVAQVLADA